MYEEIAATSVHSDGAWWHSQGQEAVPEAIMLTRWVRAPWVLCHGCSLLQHCSPPRPQQPQQEEKASAASEPPPCFNLGSARPERSSRACPLHATKQKAANPLRTLVWPLKWLLNAPSLSVDKLWCFAIPLSNYWPCSLRWLGLVCAKSQAATQGLWDSEWKEMGEKVSQSRDLHQSLGGHHLTVAFCRSPWRHLLDWGWSHPDEPCRSSPCKCGDRDLVSIQARDVVASGCWSQVTRKYLSEVAWVYITDHFMGMETERVSPATLYSLSALPYC